MPTSNQSTSPPPRRRRALQERSSAHNNERSPTRSIQSLRMVFGEKEDADMYTATPFPTKPEQILLPIPGKGQQGYISDTGFSYADTPGPSTSTWSSPTFSHAAASSTRDLSIRETWDVSSTVDTVNSPPQMWDDPTSSKSSLPEVSPMIKHEEYMSDGPYEPEYSDDEMIVLPTATPTIKAVISEPPTSPKSVSEEDQSIIAYSSPNIEQIGAPSSPNFEPIGAPSSPNFVTLDNSSVTFLPHGADNSDSEPRSNSLSSWNSRGTAVRHAGTSAPWIHTAGSSEQVSTRSPSPFHSSPPLRSVSSFRSVTRRPSASRSRSTNSSTRSFRSVSEMAAAIDSGIPIQYARIRAPSSSSRADTSVSSDRDFTPTRDFTPGPASGRWNPHLSRVSSVWSDEDLSNLAATGQPESTPVREMSMSEPAVPDAVALSSKTSNSSDWAVTDSDEEERLDSLTNLPPRLGFPTSLSSGSKRSNSNRSLKRPGTASSTVWHILPTWAKIYYRADALGLNSALSIMDVSRPGTSNSSVFNFNLMPTPLNIPRPRSPDRPHSPPQRPASPPQPQQLAQEPSEQTAIQQTAVSLPQRPGAVRFVQGHIENDPLDPRAHWVPDPEENGQVVGPSRHRTRHSWSPHLHSDRRGIPHSSSAWTAPSLDSTNEPAFGRRNVQVYSFCLGFIFPLAWIIASFLPLPPMPKLTPEMVHVNDDDVEMALESQLISLQRRRHENARWWRNLNRWMISLGVVIIVIIIALAVIGTTTGF
ncbi:uncharacterized protein N7496_010917 [Penicillium cataractarum]|uniref:Serine-rich protein n=1 Tax=Penicillium cataractarum TaxID=2100454 RepID=A0A9W9RGL1_9EURO|nr:uncharacterized protein N7496_010917 [Penicillium cataractarum]KAJ5358504.1 hypothetical protein N7496_010917 [Penicillium cataractarum]